MMKSVGDEAFGVVVRVKLLNYYSKKPGYA